MSDSILHVSYIEVRFAFRKLQRFHQEANLELSMDIKVSEVIRLVFML